MGRSTWNPEQFSIVLLGDQPCRLTSAGLPSNTRQNLYRGSVLLQDHWRLSDCGLVEEANLVQDLPLFEGASDSGIQRPFHIPISFLTAATCLQAGRFVRIQLFSKTRS
jgi:hypothetical protein